MLKKALILNNFDLEIEKIALRKTIYQFTKRPDWQMDIKLREFIESLENRIKKIDEQIFDLVSATD